MDLKRSIAIKLCAAGKARQLTQDGLAGLVDRSVDAISNLERGKGLPSLEKRTQLVISLPARYPFTAPTATIKTPILHPNVYAGGMICLGMTWLPASGLDLLVKRIIQTITFDATILNEQSPANRDALEWYRRAQRQHPSAFPTDSAVLALAEQPKKMTWSDIPSQPAKTVVSCPSCAAKMNVPTGKTGKAKCPRCNTTFDVRT